MADATLAQVNDPIIDARIRGYPTAHPPLPASAIPDQGWKPHDGMMALPLMSLDEEAFANNVGAMMRYVAEHGIEIAPHAKTPMAPDLARRLVDAGAWGTTVADIRQAAVMLKAGFRRIVLANEIGGAAAAQRLARLASAFPEAEILVFVDSQEGVSALSSAWSSMPQLPSLGLLVELGIARGGLRSNIDATRLAEQILASETPIFQLAGIAAYEGAAATADDTETAKRISQLIARMAELLLTLRKKIDAGRPLVLTAGGSVYFDMVVRGLADAASTDPNTMLLLRSGAVFFHDHGVYERGMLKMDRRGGFSLDGEPASAAACFKPALRVWAEVLSRPEDRLAICGLGMRDVATDQDLPRPLARYRQGVRAALRSSTRVLKLNDQHAFLALDDAGDMCIGDVIEFGISHPCTCLDRHAILYGLDRQHNVVSTYLTSFG